MAATSSLDGFSAGRICQNIVEMYTTETSPVNDDWEEERKLSNARIDGWDQPQPRGRLPVRKSSRRNLLAPSSQPITSIEPTTQVEADEDDDDNEDEEGCSTQVSIRARRRDIAGAWLSSHRESGKARCGW